jgi:glycerophosphoryl diester phosphodiesterase
MLVLAHRGWWSDPQEKNTRAAFAKAFAAGYGIETDVRDQAGRLVISHDPPFVGEDLMSFDALLALRATAEPLGPLAINIKADGLHEPVMEALERFRVANYFLFDMAVPDAIGYIRRDACVFTRHSEFEPTPAYYDAAAGVWLDCFERDWITPETIERHLAAGKKVTLVSPELHRRDHAPAWRAWKEVAAAASRDGALSLCTDFPDQADRYFHG